MLGPMRVRAGLLTGAIGIFGCASPTIGDAGDEIESSSGESSSSEDTSEGSTTSELDGSSSSESTSESTSETGGDDEGELVDPGSSAACTTNPGSHASVCPQGQPCPIVTDVEIDCADTLRWPISVSADGERAYLAAMSDMGGWLFTAQADAADLVALPDVLDGGKLELGVDQAGRLRLLASTLEQAYLYVIPLVGGFALQAMTETPGDPYTLPYALEFDPDNHAHALTLQDGHFLHGQRAADATWTLETIDDPDSFEANGFDRHGHVIELLDTTDPPFLQLGARVEGVTRVLSDMYSSSANPLMALQPARPSLADAGDIDYAVIYMHDQELRVVWPSGAEGWTDVAIPEATPNTNPCPLSPNCPCPATCLDDQGGFGLAVAARTSESEIWVAWTFDNDHVTWSLYEAPLCLCGLAPSFPIDESTSTLHLTRIDTNDGSLEQVLTLEIAKPAELDMQTWDRQLAVGLRMAGSPNLRVLAFDLDQL